MKRPPQLSSRPFVLTIGTTEPFVAAGLGLDLLLADRLEVRPMSLIAGISAQNGEGLFRIAAIDDETIALQCQALDGIAFAAVRIGAIPSAGGVKIIATWLRTKNIPIIFDPILQTSAGGTLVDTSVLDVTIEELFPLITCLTPNLAEAGVLAGHPVGSVAEMITAALAIGQLGPRGVLIKGGHLAEQAVDVYWDGERAWQYEASRLPQGMRGTGCALAMTIAAAMAHGQEIRHAIHMGREIVRLLMHSARTVDSQRIVA